jgi:hypothetical protein
LRAFSRTLLLSSALLFGLAPGLPAAAASGSPAAPDNAQAAPAPDAGAGSGGPPVSPDEDSGGIDADAAPPAPVPDPFLADMLNTCRDGASGDKGTLKRLEDQGWDLSVDGDTQTPYYQSFSGERDFDGVGTVDITFSQEVYPSMTEGYCSLSIDTALRHIGIADIARMSDLTGTIKQSADGIASTWQDKGTPPTTFIQVDQHERDLYFILDVTTIRMKPAAELPYVAPDTGGDGTQTDDNTDGAGMTNANS